MAKKKWPEITDHEEYGEWVARSDEIESELASIRSEISGIREEIADRDEPDVDEGVQAVLEGRAPDVGEGRDPGEAQSLERRLEALERRQAVYKKAREAHNAKEKKILSRASNWLGQQLADDYQAVVEEAAPVLGRIIELADREETIREHLKTQERGLTGSWRTPLGHLMGLKQAWPHGWLDRAVRHRGIEDPREEAA